MGSGCHRGTDAQVVRLGSIDQRGLLRMNQAFWRKWHRWVGFVAVPFLAYAAVTGVCAAVNEFFGPEEAQRERLREVTSAVTLPPSAPVWSESLTKAFAAAAAK